MTTETTTPVPAATPATTPAATPATPAAVVDEFDLAFNEIVKADEIPEGTTPAAETPSTATTPPVVTPPVTAEAAPPVETAPVVEPPPVPAEPTELEKAQARIRELEAAAAKLPAAAEPPPAEPPPVEPPRVEFYTPNADELAVMTAFQKDWPDIAKAVELNNRVSMENLARHIFHEIKRTYDPVLIEVTQRAEALESELALGTLRQEHSDYDDVHGKVEAWVDTLPTFAKMGAQQVMKEGTPQQVSELIAEYKKTHPVAATPATTVAAPAKVTELSAAAKKAAMTLSVVDSKRTAATTAADPNDFDGAWQEASK
jgi:hypothetical protein